MFNFNLKLLNADKSENFNLKLLNALNLAMFLAQYLSI